VRIAFQWNVPTNAHVTFLNDRAGLQQGGHARVGNYPSGVLYFQVAEGRLRRASAVYGCFRPGVSYLSTVSTFNT
jgi:hypothetical protein